MFKLTSLSSALAALTIASVLSGCGGGSAEPVGGATVTGPKAPATTGATSAKTAHAAAAYWRIITKFNTAADAFDEVASRSSEVPAVPANFRAAARAFSLAHTQEVAELRAYGAWPQSVQPWIDEFIAQKVMLADGHLAMSTATSWASWNKEADLTDAGGLESARLSTLIRQALGLPARAIPSEDPAGGS